jgi:hypothetical protein
MFAGELRGRERILDPTGQGLRTDQKVHPQSPGSRLALVIS